MPSRTRSRWPPKTAPETCGEPDALQLPRRQERSTRPAKRLRLRGTLRRPGVEHLSPRGTRHSGSGNGPRAAHGPPGRLARIPRSPAHHPRLPARRLSPPPGLAALHATIVASPSCWRSAGHRRHLRQPRGGAIQPSSRAGPVPEMLIAPGPALIRYDSQPALLKPLTRRQHPLISTSLTGFFVCIGRRSWG